MPKFCAFVVHKIQQKYNSRSEVPKKDVKVNMISFSSELSLHDKELIKLHVYIIYMPSVQPSWKSYLKGQVAWRWRPFFNKASLQCFHMGTRRDPDVKTYLCFRWLEIHDKTLKEGQTINWFWKLAAQNMSCPGLIEWWTTPNLCKVYELDG